MSYCTDVVEEVRAYHYRNSLTWLDTVIYITLCSYSHQKRMRLWTWCWWNSAVCLESNVRNKVATAQLRGQLFLLLQTMDSQRFLLGQFVRVEMFPQNALLQFFLAIACFIYSNQRVVALLLNIKPLQVYKLLAFLSTVADLLFIIIGEAETLRENRNWE